MSFEDFGHQFKKFGLPRGTKRGNENRRRGLEQLKRLRNAPEQLAHQEWGSTVLMIPELDFVVLCSRYPELQSPDNETNKKAWERFLASPESLPYRVRDTDRKGAYNSRGVF